MTTQPAALAAAVAVPAKTVRKIETRLGTVTVHPLPANSLRQRRYLVAFEGKGRAIVRNVGASRYAIEGSDYNTPANPYLGTLDRIAVDCGLGSDVC